MAAIQEGYLSNLRILKLEKAQKTQVYLAILQNTAEAHNLLNKEFGGTEVNPKASSLCKEILDVKSASKDNSELISKELTPTEIKKAKEILMQYQFKVKSLLLKFRLKKAVGNTSELLFGRK